MQEILTPYEDKKKVPNNQFIKATVVISYKIAYCVFSY